MLTKSKIITSLTHKGLFINNFMFFVVRQNKLLPPQGWHPKKLKEAASKQKMTLPMAMSTFLGHFNIGCIQTNFMLVNKFG